MRWTFSTEDGKQYVTVHSPVETRYCIPEAPDRFDRLDAVMMDMDGSSTDTEKLVLEAIRLMMAEAMGDDGFAFTPEDYPHIIGDSTTNHLRYLVEKYGLDPARLQHYISAYYAHYHATLEGIRDGRVTEALIEPMPGLRRFLEALRARGVRIGLVTSSLKKEADIVMPVVFEGMGLPPDYEAFYDGVIAADEVGEAFLKPHPDLYWRMAEEKLGVTDMRNAFVVEDSTAGILAARICGLAVAAVPHHHTRGHSFDLANLGVFAGGLPEVMEADFFASACGGTA
jgi:beta-phosphoglucomutase